jgi:hypothetical protein
MAGLLEPAAEQAVGLGLATAYNSPRSLPSGASFSHDTYHTDELLGVRLSDAASICQRRALDLIEQVSLIGD